MSRENVIRDDHGNVFITIKRYIAPDFTLHQKKKSYSDNYDYHVLHFSIKENFLIIEDADEEFNIKYGTSEVGALKLEDGFIYFLDKRNGWLPHLEATEKYAEILAEKEMLR